MNDVRINTKKIKRFLPPDESIHDDRAYTVNEILQMLEKFTDARSKVIVLLMASIRMRIGALSELQMGDLTEVKILGQDNLSLYKTQVYPRSKKDKYYTFCTPETKAAIDSYLDSHPVRFL